MKYVFRDGRPLVSVPKEVDADKLGHAIERLDAKTPECFVEAAQRNSTPQERLLHQCLVWDDKAAAHAHRLYLARHVLSAIDVIASPGEEPKRAFVSIRPDDGERRYFSSREIERSIPLQTYMLEAARRDLESWRRRYAQLKDLCRDIELVERKIVAIKTGAEERVAL